jgi:hypothetical protein
MSLDSHGLCKFSGDISQSHCSRSAGIRAMPIGGASKIWEHNSVRSTGSCLEAQIYWEEKPKQNRSAIMISRSWKALRYVVTKRLPVLWGSAGGYPLSFQGPIAGMTPSCPRRRAAHIPGATTRKNRRFLEPQRLAGTSRVRFGCFP